MTQGSQFGVKPMCGCFGGGQTLAGLDRPQDAKEPVGLALGIGEWEDVQELRQRTSVATGHLDRDRAVGVSVESGRGAEAPRARSPLSVPIHDESGDVHGEPLLEQGHRSLLLFASVQS